MMGVMDGPRYAMYGQPFVEQVMTATGSGRLAHALAWNATGDLEDAFIQVILEGEFDTPQRFWEARQLYTQYQLMRRTYSEEDNPYIPLADLTDPRRIWSDAEHLFIANLLDGNFEPVDLWAIRLSYMTFKATQKTHDPQFRPVGQTYVADRRW